MEFDEITCSTVDVWAPTAMLQSIYEPPAAMPTRFTALEHGVTYFWGILNGTISNAYQCLQTEQMKHAAPMKACLI